MTDDAATRILIVDDHPANLALLRAPDLILLDVMLPGLDGYAVCRRLKADPATRATPLPLLTAPQARADKLQGLEAGADDFLSKPVDPAELLAHGQIPGAMTLVTAASGRPHGGHDLTLAEETVAAAGDGVQGIVQDQGLGLPAGANDAICEPSGRGANADRRRVPGMGLGLCIARLIVEQHGRRIWAERAGEDCGTIVGIRLPSMAARAGSAAGPAGLASSAPRTSASGEASHE